MNLKERLKVEVLVFWIKGLIKPGENNRKYLTGVYLGKKLKEVIKMGENEPKKWWASKTLWFNGIATAVGVATTVIDSGLIAQHPKAAGAFLLTVTVGNKILRFMTDQGIK